MINFESNSESEKPSTEAIDQRSDRLDRDVLINQDAENDGDPVNELELDKAIVQLKNVSRVYQSRYSLADEVKALDNVSLTLKAGERLALLGKSGSGKSTLLNLLGGLDRPSSGSIVVDQQAVTELARSQMATYRQQTVGMIFQAFNLISTKTALKNVEMPFVFAGVNPEQRREKAKAALESVGLGDRLNHRPTQLSGGEQQRVAIARAVANKPKLLLADEPTGNLDSATAQSIVELITTFSEDCQAAVILVTHDEELAQDFSHRVVRLRDGRLVDSQ